MKALTVTFAAVAVALVMMGLAAWRSQPEGKKDPMATLHKTPPAYSKSGFDIRPLSKTQIDKLAERLAPDEAKVILKKGTEPAFCGNLVDNHKEGVYVCRLCGLPLFSSDAKFNSGTGWPSFFERYAADHIRAEKDDSYGMSRTEIECERCGAHLGHVFDDGPKPTGLRYCLN